MSGERTQASRVGRPPNSMAGVVEDRIIQAAKNAFLRRGFEATTLDDIATAAHASKATLYRRYRGKEALFVSVIEHHVDEVLDFDLTAFQGSGIEQRLLEAGSMLLDRMLTAKAISLMRVVVAEAPRFPLLAQHVHRRARDAILMTFMTLLAGADASTRSESLGDETLKAAREASELLVDLITVPMVFRALMGEDLAVLHESISAHLATNIPLFIRSCQAEKTLLGID